MQISTKVKESGSFRKRFGWVVLAIFLIIGLLFSKQAFQRGSHNTIRLTAESSIFNKLPKKVNGQKLIISIGKTTSDVALSGNRSVVVNPGNEFGLTIKFDQIYAGDSFDIQVARYRTSGFAFLVAAGELDFYLKEGNATKIVQGGWEILRLAFRVPAYLDKTKLSIYVWNPEEEPTYFDDMIVKHYPGKSIKRNDVQTAFKIPSFNLLIDRRDLSKLEKIRDKAMIRGLLTQEDKIWVNAKIDNGREQIPVKIRFKGDWLDHLEGTKWSFRIRTRKQHSWNGLMQFSIQKPKVRNYLDEWVMHKLMESNDVLSTKYGFVKVALNGKELGLYAYEEHFEKQLPESNKRREGAILKFSEEGFWQSKEVGIHLDRQMPIYESSDIEAFNTSKLSKDSVTNNQMKLARSLMNAYKYGNKPVGDVFDIDITARFYALMDVTKAYHALRWHNQRLYYNPVTSLLEPIAFDGYAEIGVMDWIDRPMIGYSRNHHNFRLKNEWVLQDQLFTNDLFVKRYISYLQKFVAAEAKHGIFETFSNELDYLESVIQEEVPNYKYDKKFLIENIQNIYDLIYPLKKTSLKTHVQSYINGKTQVKAFNYHCLPILVIGTGNKSSKIDHRLDVPLALQAYDNGFVPYYSDFEIKGSFKYVFFEIPGIDSTFSNKVIPWAVPDLDIPRAELLNKVNLRSNKMYKVEGKNIIFAKGKHRITSDLVFPKGYTIIISAGTELNFVQKSLFLSLSALDIKGTRDEPVRIYSSDSSANGFTILQTGAASYLKYVAFDHLKTLNYKNWTLTGAVTFYESEVEIDHCSFNQQKAEDALNIIRSNFSIDNSFIGGNPSDGIDIDFGAGTISNTFFTYNANDGIDFSGSNVIMENCIIEWSGEKGISVGEESTITIISGMVRNCPLAIASKDLSICTIYNIEIKECKQAFAAYRKKPEFGPATIEIKKYKADDVDKLFSIEKGSTLILEGKTRVGSE